MIHLHLPSREEIFLKSLPLFFFFFKGLLSSQEHHMLSFNGSISTRKFRNNLQINNSFEIVQAAPSQHPAHSLIYQGALTPFLWVFLWLPNSGSTQRSCPPRSPQKGARGCCWEKPGTSIQQQPRGTVMHCCTEKHSAAGETVSQPRGSKATKHHTGPGVRALK